MWDPTRYLEFADQRGRPFADLLARVPGTDAARVVDLGCGPGNITVELAKRWPGAQVTGVDSSPEMIAHAPVHDRVRFVEADLRTWQPGTLVDVVVSNATLQWVPGHLDEVPRLAGWLSPGGWLAFQVPGNFREPAHLLLRELAGSAHWRDRLDISWPSSHQPDVYLAALLDLGLAAEAWETTYLYVLPGEDAVLHWMSGSALRPVLAALGDDERDEFMSVYGANLRAAYPRGRYGTVLPYRRIFAVARNTKES